MSDIAISVENLGKSYLIGHNTGEQGRQETFREMLSREVRDFLSKGRNMLGGRPIVQGDEIEEFWALKDLSFQLKRGERLGIIGRNGAGKSTLLKLLSRITEPTEGRIRIDGRVASLLEVGTGFHPELTGRENVFLNGAILGMSRKEIVKKFDQIVDFAGVEKFLDTPVKRYSSGMSVRLAFAVAAHLEPEILIVDEVLAVGDAEFQKKCLNKMEDVSKEGRTILFVSHNLTAIQELCTKGLYLKKGWVAACEDVSRTVDLYLSDLEDDGDVDRTSIAVSGTDLLVDATNVLPRRVNLHDSVPFAFSIKGAAGSEFDMATLIIEDRANVRVAIIDCTDRERLPYRIPASGVLTFSGNVERLPLVPGFYNISLYLNGTWGSNVVNLAYRLDVLESGQVHTRIHRNARGHVELDYTFKVY